MSAENWLEFKAGQLPKVRAGLALLGPEITLDGHLLPLTLRRRCLEVGYFGGVRAGFLANLMSREICRRFAVKRIGHSTNGWWSDSALTSPECIEEYGVLGSWAEWMANYQPQWHPLGRAPYAMAWVTDGKLEHELQTYVENILGPYPTETP
jgi:hypothetical protein